MTDWAKSGAQTKARTKRRLLIGDLRFLLLLVLCFLVRFFFQPIGFFFRAIFSRLKIALAIEHNLPFDERRIDARVRRKRMAIENDEIGIFADVDGSESLI